MPYIAPEIVAKAKEMDLYTYLKTYEPHELVRFSGNTYTTRTHDSLKISNGKWMWWSRGIGGRSALDYLIKVRGNSFLDAVKIIMGQAADGPPVRASGEQKTEKRLLLPKENASHVQAVTYLSSRGIDIEIIRFCLRNEILYESESHHNVVFVGRDAEGKARYAALRGTGTDFIGDANGSDKNYSFRITAEKSDTVHLFESAIDLLSYATLTKSGGGDWQSEHLLSLAGVYQTAGRMQEGRVPAAFSTFLKEHAEVEEIWFHLDNDLTGRAATRAIQTALPRRYRVRDRPPLLGKDMNDELCLRLGIRTTRRAKKKERVII